VITGYSMISRSIERAGVYSSGIPFEEARVWRRLVARFKRLPRLEGRLRKLEQAASLKGAEGQEPDDD
jgi:UDP-3-O-[3-hydroxymyristoyl] glucosamine N-acyltransferase